MDRRDLIIGGGLVIAAGAALEGCSSGTDPSSWVQNLLTTIGNIQSEVKSRLTAACGVANGSVVPAVTMVIEALKAALGSTSIGAETVILGSAVEAAVQGIVSIGCSTLAPAATPGAAPAPQITINGKPIAVKWV